MQYAKLGWSNVKISRISLGGMSYGSKEPWMAPKETAVKIIKKGIDLGINYIDTADVYSDGESEKIIGEAIRGYDREELLIGTKVGLEFGSGLNNSGLSRKRLYAQLRGSLERLQTDYVDLYQIHRWDYSTDIEEVLSTLTQFVREGKVRYIGATSIYAFQIQRGVKPAVLALAWLLNKPYVTTVLLGATKPEHLDDAVQALDLKLTEDEMKLLEKPYRPHELMGPTKSPLAP